VKNKKIKMKLINVKPFVKHVVMIYIKYTIVKIPKEALIKIMKWYQNNLIDTQIFVGGLSNMLHSMRFFGISFTKWESKMDPPAPYSGYPPYMVKNILLLVIQMVTRLLPVWHLAWFWKNFNASCSLKIGFMNI